MRLDSSYLHFITREELRILASIQMGMRNHEYVPADLIAKIGNLRGGQTFKTIQKLLKNKFITHIGNKCDGYKLTYLGYDYLAIHTLMKRGLIKDVLGKIGVGKQSDIYKCVNPEGQIIVLKLTRLGRNSFRSVKKNREYIQHRTNYNWLYLSRLSSIRQFLFMQLLHSHKFATPTPIDTNRHAILMSLVDGDTLSHVQRFTTQEQIRKIFEITLETLIEFVRNGLIHGDYNQFNLMVNEAGTKLTVIDFPQCVSAKHPNAKNYFDRDVECVYKYFDKLAQKSYAEYLKVKQPGDMGEKLFRVEQYPVPQLENIEIEKRLDHEIKTLGHITLEEYNLFERYRTEEERMRAEMETNQEAYDPEEHQKEPQIEEQEHSQNEQQEHSQNEQQEHLENEEQEQSKQQLLKEEQLIKKVQKENQIRHIGNINQIDQIGVQNHHQKYDEELKNLIDQFDGLKAEEDQQVSSQQEERFKGLTAYEIRLKIKEEKRIEREKKKAVLTTDDYIKNALKKGSGWRRPTYSKGNHGTKNKTRSNNLEIKDSMV